MTSGLIAAVVAFGISLLITPVVRAWVTKRQIFDSPNHRTVHTSLIPKLGGLSIFVAFAAAGVLYFVLEGGTQQEIGLFVLCSGLVLLGLLDDLYSLSCYSKLAVETVAAGVAVYFGFRMDVLYLPSGELLALGWFGIPLSLLWIVGITNAINLLDGLDGLAAGFSIVAALVVLIVAGFTQNLFIASAALIFIMATLGFLKHNFPPARIFMGDTGSLFLGFFLACLSMKAFTFHALGTHIFALVLCFSVPIVDTTLAVIRRVSRGAHPFSPDNKHIHHRLLQAGLSRSSALFLIYLVGFLIGGLTIVLLFVGVAPRILILSSVAVFFLLALYYLGCYDFLRKKRVQESEVK